ncbi:MAG: hypothetical protein JXB48_21210 [Candidatus Latescibacteria bacterium]|nr:hypothetical protein [Candidatus Latescibacterota bacterium]
METPDQEPPIDASQETVVDDHATETVSNNDYIQDAFSDYFGGKKSETEQGKNPKTDKVDDKQPADKIDNQQVKNPKANDTGVNTDNKEKNPDPFETAFVNETGDFDLDKLVGVSLDGLSFQSNGQEKKEGEVTSPEKTVPQWKQEYEEERVFKQNVHKSRLGPIESVFSEIQESGIPDEYKGPILDVLRKKHAEILQETEQFLRERTEQRTFQKREEENDRIREEMRTSKLPELARANAVSIINQLPGKEQKEKAELYNRIMFGPDAGGELLEDMFEARYPEMHKKDKATQDKMKLKFVHELQADGARLQRHFQRAYRYLTADPKNLKRIFAQVSRTTEANVRSNAATAQKNPSGSVQRTPQAGNNIWDGYFSDPQRSKTRI